MYAVPFGRKEESCELRRRRRRRRTRATAAPELSAWAVDFLSRHPDVRRVGWAGLGWSSLGGSLNLP